nr:DUF3987 domain-containing protein [uncultured Duganella sp.]
MSSIFGQNTDQINDEGIAAPPETSAMANIQGMAPRVHYVTAYIGRSDESSTKRPSINAMAAVTATQALDRIMNTADDGCVNSTSNTAPVPVETEAPIQAYPFLSPVLDNIPQALREEKRWVVWAAEGPAASKPTKVPYDPSLPSARAKVNDPATWGTFEQAVAAYEEGGYAGIGIVLDGTGLVGIDLDNCVVEGKISPAAQMLLDSVGATYIELSPSGTGLRAFGYAENLAGGVNQVYNGLKVELYSTGRFLTVTGHHVENGAVGPLVGFAELAERIRGEQKANPKPSEQEQVPGAARQGELVRRIMSAEVYHDSLRDLAATWIATGMTPGGAVNALYGLMDNVPMAHDGRWATRRAEIPGLVASAVAKFTPSAADVSKIMAKLPVVEVPDDEAPQVEKQAAIPPHLLTIPGKLGLMVDWTNATAMKPQPMFAVQTALALGSVAMGRKFRTTNDNWPSLFFLNIGVSGAGKEHAKTAIERVLRAAKFSDLSPASEYTSDAAIDSMLRLRPTHIAIMDEFGYLLKAANAKHNTNGGTARKRIMEVFGRCGGTLQPKAYSTAALTKEQCSAMGPRYVENPALTVLGMTTPGPFYEAVGSGALTDGFMNRFIAVESDLGRQPGRFVDQIDAPDDLVRWVRECRFKGGGDLADIIDIAHSEVPVPVILDFSPEARRLFDKLEYHCIARMDELEIHGMAEMYSRVREISMRVSLIVAHSCESDVIGAEHAQWAIDYVTFWQDRAVSRYGDHISDSPFASLCNDVANLIVKAGPRGLTVHELSKRSAKFKGADSRMRRSVFDNLESDRFIKMYATKSPSGKGKTREAYIAPEFITPSDQAQ